MNKNIKSYTHVALILDASGSMSRLKQTTISTMKEFFSSLKSEEDKTIIDLWQFNSRVVHLINGEDIEKGASEAIENYGTGGFTALNDAICIGIDSLGAKFAQMEEADRPDAVVFAILTDGCENASTEFSREDVKARIQHQTEKYSWTFRFLAANQDAVLTGSTMGLSAEACTTIEATDEGVHHMQMNLSEFCSGEVRYKARKSRLKRLDRFLNV